MSRDLDTLVVLLTQITCNLDALLSGNSQVCGQRGHNRRQLRRPYYSQRKYRPRKFFRPGVTDPSELPNGAPWSWVSRTVFCISGGEWVGTLSPAVQLLAFPAHQCLLWSIHWQSRESCTMVIEVPFDLHSSSVAAASVQGWEWHPSKNQHNIAIFNEQTVASESFCVPSFRNHRRVANIWRRAVLFPAVISFVLFQNAFWFCLGWCLFFMVPSLILSVKITKYMRQFRVQESHDRRWAPKTDSHFTLNIVSLFLTITQLNKDSGCSGIFSKRSQKRTLIFHLLTCKGKQRWTTFAGNSGMFNTESPHIPDSFSNDHSETYICIFFLPVYQPHPEGTTEVCFQWPQVHCVNSLVSIPKAIPSFCSGGHLVFWHVLHKQVCWKNH